MTPAWANQSQNLVMQSEWYKRLSMQEQNRFSKMGTVKNWNLEEKKKVYMTRPTHTPSKEDYAQPRNHIFYKDIHIHKVIVLADNQIHTDQVRKRIV